MSNFKIPIICVGNIYIGGTGKTPACIYIAKELSKHRKKPIILRKVVLPVPGGPITIFLCISKDPLQ